MLFLKNSDIVFINGMLSDSCPFKLPSYWLGHLFLGETMPSKIINVKGPKT